MVMMGKMVKSSLRTASRSSCSSWSESERGVVDLRGDSKVECLCDKVAMDATF